MAKKKLVETQKTDPLHLDLRTVVILLDQVYSGAGKPQRHARLGGWKGLRAVNYFFFDFLAARYAWRPQQRRWPSTTEAVASTTEAVAVLNRGGGDNWTDGGKGCDK